MEVGFFGGVFGLLLEGNDGIFSSSKIIIGNERGSSAVDARDILSFGDETSKS